MIFLPKCRPFYVVLERVWHWEKGMALERRGHGAAPCGAMLKLARGNTISLFQTMGCERV